MRTMLRSGAGLVAGLIAAAPAPLQAQGLLSGCDRSAVVGAVVHLDALRIAEIRGDHRPDPLAAARPGTRRLRCDDAAESLPVLRLLPVAVVAAENTAYPRETLNGLRWGGRGLSSQLEAGIAAAWGPFTAAFSPAVAYHQNASFPSLPVQVPGSSSFAYYWRPRNIDWPQRFGRDPFWWSHPGESYVRADAFNVALGFSTERLRWGPARRNPLLMSGAAPGFPQVFLGTSRPADIRIGDVSVEAVWGHLAESDYFDTTSDNDRRMLAGLIAAFQPRGLETLTLGFSRAYQRTLPPGGLPLLDYLRAPYGGLLDNDLLTGAADNDLFSVFARWVFPASDVEVYGEFARDDFWDGWGDLLQEPEHSAGVTLGLQKLVEIGGGGREQWLRIAAEATSLNFSETQRSRRPEVIFYTHSSVVQGHTHRGQLLGAPIGPSSDAQSLEIDWLRQRWLAGFYVERVRYANDIYWQALADRYTTKGHDVEVTGGIRGALSLARQRLELSGEVAWSGRSNRHFIPQVGPMFETGFEHNVGLQVGAAWRPGDR